jgi:hypothetical protein
MFAMRASSTIPIGAAESAFTGVFSVSAAGLTGTSDGLSISHAIAIKPITITIISIAGVDIPCDLNLMDRSLSKSLMLD